MNWINETFDVNLPEWAQIAILFSAVLVALLVLIWLFRLIFGRGRMHFQRGRKARIGMVEIAAVDEERRLILLRRDHVEHLVLVGGASDLIVEQGILPAVYSEPETQKTPKKASPAPIASERIEPEASSSKSTATSQETSPVAPVAAGAGAAGVMATDTLAKASETAETLAGDIKDDLGADLADKLTQAKDSAVASTTDFTAEAKEAAASRFDKIAAGHHTPEPTSDEPVFDDKPTTPAPSIDEADDDLALLDEKEPDDMQRLIEELTGGKK